MLELRLGGKLDAIRYAIRTADGFVLLLTPASIGSDRVQCEARWALETKMERPSFALLPLLRVLDRPALKLLFGEAELVSIAFEDGDPIEGGVPAIAQALGLAAQDATPRPDPLPAPPMAELSFEGGLKGPCPSHAPERERPPGCRAPPAAPRAARPGPARGQACFVHRSAGQRDPAH